MQVRMDQIKILWWFFAGTIPVTNYSEITFHLCANEQRSGPFKKKTQKNSHANSLVWRGINFGIRGLGTQNQSSVLRVKSLGI